MSVKDKIAMWNSMAVNPHPAPPAKLALSETHPKPKQQEGEKKPPAVPPSVAAQPHTDPPLEVPASFKKTESIDHNPPELIQPVKPSLHQKPNQPVNLPEAGKAEKEGGKEGENKVLPKFMDIMKQLEKQTAGKGIYFTAPASVKKVEVVTGEGGGAAECEVEREIPKCSVKEQAAKLAHFYEQKRLNELQKNQEKAKDEVQGHQKSHQTTADPQKEVNNTLNIAPHPQVDEKAQVKAQVKAEEKAEVKAGEEASGNGLAVRVPKAKKTRQQFDSDED